MQSLIDSKWLTFQEQRASAENNPSTVHANASTKINFDQVAVIEQRHGGQSFDHVHLCLPDEEIGMSCLQDFLEV